jgi:hypothetical protein
MQAGRGRFQRVSRISRPFYNAKTFTAPQQRESSPAIGRKLAAQASAADWIFAASWARPSAMKYRCVVIQKISLHEATVTVRNRYTKQVLCPFIVLRHHAGLPDHICSQDAP